MKRLRLAVSHRRDRGAVAVVVALCMVMLLAAAALGMDIAKLAYEKQALRAAIDAGAQAGSYALNDATKAEKDAKDFAVASAPDLQLDKAKVLVSFYCAVGVNAAGTGADETQVPYICDPGPKWTRGTPAEACNETTCLLPCDKDKANSPNCNTVKVSYEKIVKFAFGPAIGIFERSTGAVSSASCKGMCGGSPIPNPMDVVVMADRTASMDSEDIDAVKTGVKSMLATMNRDQQFVAFGAIHKSYKRGTCETSVVKSGEEAFKYTYTYDKWGRQTSKTAGDLSGTWVPVPFSKNYTTGSVEDGTVTTNNASSLVTQIDCMAKYGKNDHSPAPGYLYPGDEYPEDANNGLGTHLASALKGAARYLYGSELGSTNNLAAGGFPDRSELGTVKKVIILETDGRPEEIFDSSGTALDLTNGKDIGDRDGEDACKKFRDTATKVKALHDSLIITIAFGDAATINCKGGSTPVRDILSAAASNKPGTTTASAANTDCSTETGRRLENGDGDYYFCAATANELKTIFTAAVGSATLNTKFIKVPGISG